MAVISLALGIGANSAMFSLADSLLLRPLPVARASEVLTVNNSTPDTPFEGTLLSRLCRDSRAQPVVCGTRRLQNSFLVMGGDLGIFLQMRLANLVSANFFRVLFIVPAVGRDFLPQEGQVAGKDRVVILGMTSGAVLWQRRFGDRHGRRS